MHRLLLGEVSPDYPTGPDQLQQLRNQFQEFAQMCGARISELERQVAQIRQGLNHAGGDAVSIPTSDNAAKWEQIKRRQPPRLQEAIDVLLLQGPLRRTQLANALKMDYSNCVKNVVGVLLRQGLLIDNGKELQLKQL